MYKNDLVGMRFGKLVVKSYDHTERLHYKNSSSSESFWLCDCDCGGSKIYSGHTLLKGRAKNCGCRYNHLETSFNELYANFRSRAQDHKFDFSLSKEEVKYLTSQNCTYCGKFPSQIANKNKEYPYIFNGIDRIDSSKYYLLNNCTSCCWICNNMKRDMPLLEFKNHIDIILRNYNIFNLEHFDFEIKKEININHSGFNRIIYGYKTRANKKNYEFSLSKEEFFNLTQQHCFYCGIIPQQIHKSRKSNFVYNGVDRLDNLKGYTIENAVSCCGTCNGMKLTQTVDEFINQLVKISNYCNFNNLIQLSEIK